MMFFSFYLLKTPAFTIASDSEKPLSRFEYMCALLDPEVAGNCRNKILFDCLKFKSPFTDFNTLYDVPENQIGPDNSEYLGIRIQIGYENGIIKGYSDGTLKPDDLMTKQGLAAIAYRILLTNDIYFSKNSENPVPDLEFLKTFNDYDQVSPYASDALSALIKAGYIHTKDNNIIIIFNNIVLVSLSIRVKTTHISLNPWMSCLKHLILNNTLALYNIINNLRLIHNHTSVKNKLSLC